MHQLTYWLFGDNEQFVHLAPIDLYVLDSYGLKIKMGVFNLMDMYDHFKPTSVKKLNFDKSVS